MNNAEIINLLTAMEAYHRNLAMERDPSDPTHQRHAEWAKACREAIKALR